MVRIAINGFGRIGRNVLRALYESGRNQSMQVVAINELADPAGMAHLLKFDTSHGHEKALDIVDHAGVKLVIGEKTGRQFYQVCVITSRARSFDVSINNVYTLWLLFFSLPYTGGSCTVSYITLLLPRCKERRVQITMYASQSTSVLASRSFLT